MRITITSYTKGELDKRIKDYEKQGYRLKNRGEEYSGGKNFRAKYWAVLEYVNS